MPHQTGALGGGGGSWAPRPINRGVHDPVVLVLVLIFPNMQESDRSIVTIFVKDPPISHKREGVAPTLSGLGC